VGAMAKCRSRSAERLARLPAILATQTIDVPSSAYAVNTSMTFAVPTKFTSRISFAVPEAGDRAAVRTTASMEAIACAACARAWMESRSRMPTSRLWASWPYYYRRLCTASSRMFWDPSARRRMISFADALEATAWPIPSDPMMMVTVFEGWVSSAILSWVFAASVGCLYCLCSINEIGCKRTTASCETVG
jgi:hypothetical protein